MIKNSINTVSLFTGAGIGEYYLKEIGINVVTANEIIERRAECYSYFYPNVKMVIGNIKDSEIKNKIIKSSNNDCRMLLTTPPCQGVSSIGKNKNQEHYELDDRNFLIYDIFQIIESINFDYILIENVPRFLKMFFPYKDQLLKLTEILRIKYSSIYKIDDKILDAKDYGVAQSRPRAFIIMYKKDKVWNWPDKEKKITLEQAIGHLPSLESGEISEIPKHYAKTHNDRAIIALKHTPTGKSALKNNKYYPKKENGKRIIGFHNTYKRMKWDQPAHARTTYSSSISSHNNVHPGRMLSDGTYTDARALTLLETYLVSSLPQNFDFPKNVSDTFKYTMIGEAVPPRLLKKVIQGIQD